MTFIVSIEDRFDPGSPYYIVATDNQREVETLEKAAHAARLNPIVRRADPYGAALKWLEKQT